MSESGFDDPPAEPAATENENVQEEELPTQKTYQFDDSASEVYEISSAWKAAAKVKDKNEGTKPIKTRDAEGQSLERTNVAVQTTAKEEIDNIKIVEDNSEKLFHFLTTMEPQVVHVLARNMSSTAFDGYDMGSKDDRDSIKLQTSLEHSEFVSQGCVVTDLSWNSTGATVVAAYGRLDHEDWCTHRGGACMWNVNRRSLSTVKADTVLETSSCLMSVAFHPKHPAVLVGGTFNGDVMMWDTSAASPVVVQSVLDSVTHGDPVESVQWTWDLTAKHFEVVSIGADGKILVWDPANDFKAPKSGLLLFTRGDKRRFTGGSSASFSHEDKSMFVVGTEAGALFKCSLDRDPNRLLDAPGLSTELTFPSPITFSYEKHPGPVHGVSCSPFHRNIFASCSTDAVRVYDMLNKQQLLSLEPCAEYLFDVAWSPTRPMVLFVAGGDGNLFAYDLQTSRTSEVVRLEVGKDGVSLLCLAVNEKSPNVLAVGDGSGRLHVCLLSPHLSAPTAGEQDALNSLSATEAEAD